jgi:DNA-binding response OmpR family regulator
VVSVNDDRRMSISAGAQEHLAKPCPSAVMTAAMARLARRKTDNDQTTLLKKTNPIAAHPTKMPQTKTIRSA